MDSERFRQIQDLLHAALEREPGERGVFLGEACAGDPDLRREVESLLEAHAKTGAVDHLADDLITPLIDPPKAAGSLEGRTVAHFEILEKLGGGGMGVVYKARHLKLDRLVALKFLPPHLSANPDANARFIHEAQAASALDHVNVCTIYDIGQTDEGRLFIAMAYYAGQTLKKKIASGPLSPAEALDIAIQIAQGLARAHGRDMVHRDIKPANTLITEDGLVKIVDFGLAKLEGKTQLTREGTTVGTVAYMSPEQAQGFEVDPRTDIWSLGVVLYEMLTGRQPFPGDNEQAMIYAIINQDPEPITGLRTGVPMALERIVTKAMAKRPEERYQHVDEMLVDLKALKKELTAKPPTARPARRRVPAQRNRAVVYGAVAGLVVLALLALLLFPSQPAAEPQKSIAVLPFENLNRNAEDDYFSDGITEDILAHLSKIADLRVISSAATRSYRGSDMSPRAIGGELQVATLLTGSVQRSGDHLRIRCELIDAQTEAQIWAETYDRELEDVFAIQSEVAQHIARTLQAQLSPEEQQRLAQQPTADLTAYQYYLKGRDYYSRYTLRDNEDAIELFKKAIALDPGYALAWAGLGDAYGQRPHRFGFAVSWLDSSIAASRNALALDPDAAEAHKALSVAYFAKGWFDEARLELHKAVDLNPNYQPAISNIGVLYIITGALDEALPWLKKAVTLDPTRDFNYKLIGYTYRLLDDSTKAAQWLNEARDLKKDALYFHELGLLYLSHGQDQLALDQIDQLLLHNPDNPASRQYAGHLAGYVGNLAQARQYYQQSLAEVPLEETDPSNFWREVGLAHVLWKEGQQEEARKLIGASLDLRRRFVEQGGEESTVRYTIAALYAIQGDKEEAYTWLQEAIDAGWREYRLGLRDPWLENLREDERFRQMMAQVKTMIDTMRRRAEDHGW